MRGIGRACCRLLSRARPGRLHDQAAVRQERAGGPVQPHGLREAPRGRARLPALAQVVEAEDPHRVPEHDLLRQRRLRDRVGRTDLLRPRPQPRLRQPGRPLAPRCSTRPAVRAARRHRLVALRLRPGRAPAGATQRAQLRAARRCSSRATSPGRSTRGRRRRCRPATASSRRPRRSPSLGRLLRRLGAASRCRPLRRPARVRRRPQVKTTLDLDLQQAAVRRSEPLSAERARRRRSWRSKTRPARSARWSAGATTRKPVQPRHPGPAPARLGVQGLRPRRRAEEGHLARLVWTSKQKVFTVPHSGGKEIFVVNNYEGAYVGLEHADRRDRLLRQLGLRRSRARRSGTRRIARLAHAHGHPHAALAQPRDDARRPQQGVTPLDMAHAYETLAHGGQRVSGTLGAEQRPARSDPRGRRGSRQQRDRASTTDRPRSASSPKTSPQTETRCSRRDRERHRDAARRSAGSRPARPARPRTTATPGSSASTRSTRSPCGSAIPTSSGRC